MNRIVVTGATGAIGTALLRECIKNNTEALVITHESSKRNGNIPKSPLVRVLCCELDSLESSVFRACEGYDVFYHLAWMGASGPGRNDRALQEKNEKYAKEAVRLAKRLGCKSFIGAGSQAEYGRVASALRPDTPCNPENEYGKSKLSAGISTGELARELKMAHTWVRILSVYGPCDSAGSMVMQTIDKLLAGEVPKLTKGEQIWDYLYSDDAAKAFYALGEKSLWDADNFEADTDGCEGADGKVYVLGSGCARQLKDYIEDIRETVASWLNARDEKLGKVHRPVVDLGAVPYSDEQVMFLKADISDICRDTGWKPETEFKHGIENILNEEIFS